MHSDAMGDFSNTVYEDSSTVPVWPFDGARGKGNSFPLRLQNSFGAKYYNVSYK